MVELESPRPDVPETNRTVVAREDNRTGHFAATMPRQNPVSRFPVDFLVFMDEQAVVKHGDSRGRHQLFALVFGSGKKDVIGLPFARSTARIHQWRSLRINCRALAVRTPLDIEGV